MASFCILRECLEEVVRTLLGDFLGGGWDMLGDVESYVGQFAARVAPKRANRKFPDEYGGDTR